jgi:hypothetical protein
VQEKKAKIGVTPKKTRLMAPSTFWPGFVVTDEAPARQDGCAFGNEKGDAPSSLAYSFRCIAMSRHEPQAGSGSKPGLKSASVQMPPERICFATSQNSRFMLVD